MKTSDFSFDLPQELIAQEPTRERGTSRLLVLDRETGERSHRNVVDLPSILPADSVVVFNNSRVRKARIYGLDVESESASEREFLLLERTAPTRWRGMTRNAKRVKPGRRFRFPDDTIGTIASIDGPYREIAFDREIDDDWLDRYGHVPLPPYIQRPDTEMDSERYQTVYAGAIGSVAAPTAGLHFTPAIFDALKAKGIQVEYVTLHVGIGTFLPVRTDTLEDHTMHHESYAIDEETAKRLTRARNAARPIVAVGTTAVRTLEAAWDSITERITSGSGETNLFIYPGYEFRVVRHLFTNFHTPESSLVMLVSAFAGRTSILESYHEAIEQRYRFFSYGDAMLIL